MSIYRIRNRLLNHKLVSTVSPLSSILISSSSTCYVSNKRTVHTFSNKSYYQILGLKRTATSEEIKHAFARLVKELHPDTNSRHVSTPSSSTIETTSSTTTTKNNLTSSSSISNATHITNQTIKFMELKEAFDVLRDPLKRKKYDEYLQLHNVMHYDPEKLQKRVEIFQKYYQTSSSSIPVNNTKEYNNLAGNSLIPIFIRPRLLLMTPLLALLSWYLMSFTNDHHHQYYIDNQDKIKAWYNPM